MNELERRMSLLYSLSAFVILLAFVFAGAAIDVLLVGRALTAQLHAVAKTVPSIAATSSEAPFGVLADSIIHRTRGPEVDVTVESPAGERYADPSDADSDSESDDGAPDMDGPPPDLPPPRPPSTVTKESAESSPSGLVALFVVPSEKVVVPGATVLLFPSPAHLSSLETTFIAEFVGGILLSAIVAIAVGRTMAVKALAPVREVVAELHRFGAGDFATRTVSRSSAAGYAELANAYNAASEQVRRALGERTKADADMRRFIADAAHELRTPLTVVTGYIELLRSGLDRAWETRIYATIDAENRRMRDLISNLLALARLDAPQVAPPEVVDLSHVIARAIDGTTTVGTTNQLHVDVRPGLNVCCRAEEMNDAISNLLVNAAKYAPGANVQVVLQRAGDSALLEIADDGPGMSAIDRDNAFRRFYRGASEHVVDGSGLGLSIVERVVTRAHGRIELATSPGTGARFTIVLPLATETRREAIASDS